MILLKVLPSLRNNIKKSINTIYFLNLTKTINNRYSKFSFNKKFSTNIIDNNSNSHNNEENTNILEKVEEDYLSKKILNPKKYKLSDLTLNILKHLENNQRIYLNLCEESVKLSYEISESSSNDFIKDELLRVNKQINKYEKENVYYYEYNKIIYNIFSTTNLLEEAIEIGEDELIKSANIELEIYYKELSSYQEDLINFLIPNDKDDINSIKLEIKSATGGLESTLFAEDLLQMYQKFCDVNYFKFDVETYIPSESAAKKGCKNGIFKISGENIYNYFKYESGVHKVQRVPITEKNGRIHSSTCQIAILVDKKFEAIEIDEADLKIEYMRAGGAGGGIPVAAVVPINLLKN